MSVYAFSLEQARKQFASNQLARWNGGEAQKKGKIFATTRLTNGDTFYPGVAFSKKIAKTDNIFTIGSCFARNIERTLDRLGMQVASVRIRKFFPGILEGGFVNRYNTASILNELRWAAGETFRGSYLIEDAPGLYSDPHSHPVPEFRNVSKEKLLEIRERTTRYFAQVYSVDVVTITLGLIEGWFDKREGVFLNCLPEFSFIKDRQRFEFRVLSYEENMANLAAIHAILKQHNPDAVIIVTVSPVPLSATFTDRDVVTANMLSKSMLRTCAETWSTMHDNVEYFPSYEMAMMSERSVVYREDAMHVRTDFVEKIMRHFIENCVETVDGTPLSSLSQQLPRDTSDSPRGISAASADSSSC